MYLDVPSGRITEEPSRGPSRLAVYPLLVALAVAACRPSPTPFGRFLPAEAKSDFDFKATRKVDPAVEWRFGGGRKRGPEPVACAPGCAATEGGIEVGGSDSPTKVEWRASWRAEDVATVELALNKQVSLGGPVFLRWTAFEGAERWSGEYKTWPVTGDARYTFDVHLHHDWRGTIETIGFSWLADRPVRVNRVRGARVTTLPDWRAALGDEALRVDLAHEVRPALVAWPGSPVKRRGIVPSGAVLRLGVGVTQHVFANVRFQVRARVGFRSEIVWQKEVAQSRGEAGRWFDGEVDLRRFAGREVELSLEVVTSTRLDPAWGLAFWANPEVIAGAVDGRPDVVLVSIDTLRADHVGAYGSTMGLTPAIDAWASGATVFRQCVAAAPWTLPSHVSMLTGLDATTHGMNCDVRAPFEAEPLAVLLRRAGYETVGFTGGVYLHPDFGFARGFDRYTYWEGEMAHRLEDELGRNVAAVEEALRPGPRRPVFAFLHTYVVHEPMRLHARPEEDEGQRLLGPELQASGASITLVKEEPTPESGFAGASRAYEAREGSHVRRFGSDEAGQALIRLAYRSGVRAMDRTVGPLLQSLSGKKTVVVFTSDHGESLGEHGRFGHGYLTDENVLVPLILALGREPGGTGASPQAAQVAQQVRLIDLAPTILDLVGVSPARRLDGVSLVPAARGLAPAIPRTAWTYSPSKNFGLAVRFDGTLKSIWNDTAWSQVHGPGGSFDLAADPGEQRPLDESDRTRAMQAAAREKLRTAAGGILELRLANGGAGELQIEMTGGLVNPRRVKLLGEGCSCVTASRAGAMTAVVASGRSVEIRFLGEASARATLAVTYREGDVVTRAPDRRLSPRTMSGPVVLELGPQGWTDRASDRAAAVRVTAVPGRLTAQSSGRRETPEQARQLRNLGYLQ